MRKVVDESTGEQRGKQYPHCRQQYSLGKHRTDIGQFCVHATRKQNNAEGYHTDELGIGSAVELKSQTIATESQTYQ